jgi:threonine synthase
MYISTRDNQGPVSASQAIYLGMVPGGGLFVPEKIPRLSLEQIEAMEEMDYPRLAKTILGLFLDDYTDEELQDCADKAYGRNFFHEDIAPITVLEDFGGVLELWHGPTAAFKDMALQIMPHLLSKALIKEGSGNQVLILVATSGDTGKAALEGFKNVPGIKIAVFYPNQGVSKVQELQMCTTDGDNTYVIAIQGNFDDCQAGVKQIFGDQELAKELLQRKLQLSSANSINWGRLAPQIVYYFYSYLSLTDAGCINMGEPVNFVVPTGNFGNIAAAWYAKSMGLPIGKLICASNDNKVLTDFFATGIYDRNRPFYKTQSPSMDILISSNLERFLFEMTEHDGKQVNAWMQELNQTGKFQVSQKLLTKMQELIWAGYADEAAADEMIRNSYRKYQYVMDPHTAVGAVVQEQYRQATGDNTFCVLDATASPFKFSKSVMEALGNEKAPENLDELQIVEALSGYTGMPVHPALKDLEKRKVLHTKVAEISEMKAIVLDILDGTY